MEHLVVEYPVVMSIVTRGHTVIAVLNIIVVNMIVSSSIQIRYSKPGGILDYVVFYVSITTVGSGEDYSVPPVFDEVIFNPGTVRIVQKDTRVESCTSRIGVKIPDFAVLYGYVIYAINSDSATVQMTITVDPSPLEWSSVAAIDGDALCLGLVDFDARLP